MNPEVPVGAQRHDLPRCHDCRFKVGDCCERLSADLRAEGVGLRHSASLRAVPVRVELTVRDDFGCVLWQPRVPS